jgi:hypothetical protein
MIPDVQKRLLTFRAELEAMLVAYAAAGGDAAADAGVPEVEAAQAVLNEVSSV